MDSQAKTKLMHDINDQDWKVAEQKQKVKTVKEELQDEVEALPEYAAVEKIQMDLENAKTRLQQAVLASETIEGIKDRLAEEKAELGAREEILSHLLIKYSTTQQVRNIDIQSENREIKIVAKVGKKLDQQQELPLL